MRLARATVAVLWPRAWAVRRAQALERIGHRGSVSGQEGGPSPVDEKHSEVAVAPFGDGSETPGPTGGGLAGGEAKEAGEGSARGKATHIADGGDEGSGREDADAGDGQEEADGRDEGSEAFELGLEVVGSGLEFVDFEEGLGKGPPEIGGQRSVLESLVGLGQEGTGALGYRMAELAQEASKGVDACGPGGDIAGT